MNELKANAFSDFAGKNGKSVYVILALGWPGSEAESFLADCVPDRDLLPGRVGPIVMSRNDIQGPFSFEFSEGFFLGSSSGHKIPQRRSAQFRLVLTAEYSK